MAKGLKYNIGIRALKKLSGKKTRERSFLPFDEVKEVLVTWDELQNETDLEHIQKFIKFLGKNGKHVVSVVYYHKRKLDKIPAPADDDTYHLSRNDFNAFGLPKTVQIKKIMAQQFDYFINLNMDGRLPLKSIAGLTTATCRIGYNRKKAIDFYDLIIGNPDDASIDKYIQDLEFYLQKIG